MTPKERIRAALSGITRDRKPVLCWSESSVVGVEPDALVCPWSSIADSESDGTGPMILAEVDNPFGLALKSGLGIVQAFKDSPEDGEAMLAELIEETRASMVLALGRGADGIFYVLHGAQTKDCTPMQYGGWFLEHDRQLLASVSEASLNVLFAVGESDAYLDVVCDLPAHLFAWDVDSSALSSRSLRTLHAGPQATTDPDSEVLLLMPKSMKERIIEKESIGTV